MMNWLYLSTTNQEHFFYPSIHPPPPSLTCHHAIGGLLVAVVTGGDWVMQVRGAVAKCIAEGGGGQVHVGALGGLTQRQPRWYWWRRTRDQQRDTFGELSNANYGSLTNKPSTENPAKNKIEIKTKRWWWWGIFEFLLKAIFSPVCQASGTVQTKQREMWLRCDLNTFIL